jgi:hypothetical protein
VKKKDRLAPSTNGFDHLGMEVEDIHAASNIGRPDHRLF